VFFLITVKLSAKNQIVIPRETREKLGLKAGDRLKVLVKGETICLVREPESFVERLYASGKNVYDNNYLNAERESWEK